MGCTMEESSIKLAANVVNSIIAKDTDKVKEYLKDRYFSRINLSDLTWVFISACYYDNLEVVLKVLENSNFNPSIEHGEHSVRALLFAIKNHNTTIVQILLNHPRVDPKIEFDRVALNAVIDKSFECLKLLVMDKRVEFGDFNFLGIGGQLRFEAGVIVTKYFMIYRNILQTDRANELINKALMEIKDERYQLLSRMVQLYNYMDKNNIPKELLEQIGDFTDYEKAVILYQSGSETYPGFISKFVLKLKNLDS